MSDLFGMFKKVIGVPQEEMDEYEGEAYDRDVYYDNRQATFSQYEDSRQKSAYASQERGKVLDMPNEMNDMKVAVKKPAQYEDARVICDKLKAFAPVVVNLEKLDQKEAQRVVDFIMGACYTMDGHVEEIKEDVFLVAPSMVNIEKEMDETDRSAKTSSFFGRFSF